MPDREPRDDARYDKTLYASPRTKSYKDSFPTLIRVAVFAILAVGGAVAFSRMASAPVAEAPTVEEQRQQMAFNRAQAAPVPLPDAEPAAKGADAPATAAKPKAAPAPVPEPLAKDTTQPVDLDPTTPEVLSPIPEVPANGAP